MAVETRQVVAGLQEFETQPVSHGVERGSGKHMYWRRADGYIVVLPAWDSEFMRQWKDKGYTPLPQYGQFYLWNPEENWNANIEPYRRIFKMGGAHEFPVEQIIEAGWHRKPPYPGVEFPQLKGVKLTDVQCPTCLKWFASDAALRKHESIAHSEVAETARLARAWLQASQQVQGPQTEVLKLIAEQFLRVIERQEMLEQMLRRLDRQQGGGHGGSQDSGADAGLSSSQSRK
jgi:hypothetical protein